MAELVLDSQQAELVAAAASPLVVLDESGREVGVLTPKAYSDDAPLSITPEELTELVRRMSDPCRDWPTTQEVLARLKSRVDS